MTLAAAVEERPLATSEAALAALGMPIVLTLPLYGPLDLHALRAAADDLVDLHPVLSSRIVLPDEHYMLQLDRSLPRPRLSLDCDVNGIAAPHPLGTPVFRIAAIKEDQDRHTLAFAVHHAICDAISVFTLGDTLWRSYTARVTGRTPQLPPPATGLPRPVEEHFRARFSEAELADFLSHRAARVRGLSPACMPTRTAPQDPEPETAAHTRQLRLTADQTAQLMRAIDAAQVNLHAMACGIALRAVHAQTETPNATRTMTCYSTIDLRRRVKPPLPRHQLVLAASAQESVLEVGPNDQPADIGRRVWEQLRAAATNGTVEKCIAGLSQMTHELATVPTSVSVSNLVARTPLVRLPPDLVAGPVEGWAITSAPFPIVTFTGSENNSAGGFCITLNLGRRWFTAGQADGLSEAFERIVHTTLRP